jgi:NADH-quinone oxidoreductase subunit K
MEQYLFTNAPLQNMLALSAILFSLGLYTIVTRKNAVAILMGIELVLNAANINFVAFAQYGGHGVTGIAFAVFVMVLAAAEAAVALAIIIGIYQNFGRVDVDQAAIMKE